MTLKSGFTDTSCGPATRNIPRSLNSRLFRKKKGQARSVAWPLHWFPLSHLIIVSEGRRPQKERSWTCHQVPQR